LFVVFSFQGKKRILKWRLMAKQQYTMAESQLIARIQAMRETESGARIVLPKKATSGGQNSVNTPDNEYDQPISSEHQAAVMSGFSINEL
jgi:hypothetical protein